MLTTEQMDDAVGIDTADLWKQCTGCGEWNHYHGAIDKCQFCGGSRFNPQSTISNRTFNIERAKKATASVKRRLRK